VKQQALFGRVHPPTWRGLIAELRRVNEAYDGPGPVCLDVHGRVTPWELVSRRTSELAGFEQYGREELPGDGRPFDAPAAARRLLAALKAGELWP
jgi:hypothetical protein